MQEKKKALCTKYAFTSEAQAVAMGTKPILTALLFWVLFWSIADKVIEHNCRTKTSFVIQDSLFRMSFDAFGKGIWITKKKKKKKRAQNDLHKCAVHMRTEEEIVNLHELGRL